MELDLKEVKLPKGFSLPNNSTFQYNSVKGKFSPVNMLKILHQKSVK